MFHLQNSPTNFMENAVTLSLQCCLLNIYSAGIRDSFLSLYGTVFTSIDHERREQVGLRVIRFRSPIPSGCSFVHNKKGWI